MRKLFLHVELLRQLNSVIGLIHHKTVGLHFFCFPFCVRLSLLWPLISSANLSLPELTHSLVSIIHFSLLWIRIIGFLLQVVREKYNWVSSPYWWKNIVANGPICKRKSIGPMSDLPELFHSISTLGFLFAKWDLNHFKNSTRYSIDNVNPFEKNFVLFRVEGYRCVRVNLESRQNLCQTSSGVI